MLYVFEVPMAVTVKSTVFWVITLCSSESAWRFRRASCLLLLISCLVSSLPVKTQVMYSFEIWGCLFYNQEGCTFHDDWMINDICWQGGVHEQILWRSRLCLPTIFIQNNSWERWFGGGIDELVEFLYLPILWSKAARYMRVGHQELSVTG